ncbi:hypothetical protein FQZ97_1158250 [compost metagenome]
MLPPHRAVVEGGQAARAAVHGGKTAQPDEAVGCVQVTELAHDGHAHRFLRFHERPVEQINQHVALAGTQGVLAQFDHLAVEVDRRGRFGERWPGGAG